MPHTLYLASHNTPSQIVLLTFHIVLNVVRLKKERSVEVERRLRLKVVPRGTSMKIGVLTAKFSRRSYSKASLRYETRW